MPAHTPVVIECLTTDVTVLQPVEMPADEGDPSVMKGIFFDEYFNKTGETPQPTDVFKYYNLPLKKAEVKDIQRQFVRVFNKGKNTKNPLGFFSFIGDKVTANKGFIDMTDVIPVEEEAAGANVAIVDAQTFADGITEVKTAEKSNVIYDLQGRIVNNPTKGLYIVNGKKVIK